MYSSKVLKKSASSPKIIINNYQRELDLLNCVSLKARYDLRDKNKSQQKIERKDLEYRKKLLNSRLAAKKYEEEDDISRWSNELILQLKMLSKLEKNNNETDFIHQNYNNYMTPIEERQKYFYGFYKGLLNEICKKDGMGVYVKKMLPHFVSIKDAQNRIQKIIIKSKSVLNKNKNKKINLKSQNSVIIPRPRKYLYSSSQSHSQNNSAINISAKKFPAVNLSSINSYKNSISSQSEVKKFPIIKFFPFNELGTDNNIVSKKDNIEGKNVNLDEINKESSVKIKKNKNHNTINTSSDYYNERILFDKNLTPITDTTRFKVLSKRGNIQFYNSIWRTKDIKHYIHPYNPNELSGILKEIKEERKKIFQ